MRARDCLRTTSLPSRMHATSLGMCASTSAVYLVHRSQSTTRMLLRTAEPEWIRAPSQQLPAHPLCRRRAQCSGLEVTGGGNGLGQLLDDEGHGALGQGLVRDGHLAHARPGEGLHAVGNRHWGPTPGANQRPPRQALDKHCGSGAMGGEMRGRRDSLQSK